MAVILVLGGVTVMLCLLSIWEDRHLKALTAAHLHRIGYRLKTASPARLFDHPDFLSARLSQRTAYRFVAIDNEGALRNGCILFHRGFFFFHGRVPQVIWDGAPPEPIHAFPVILKEPSTQDGPPPP